MVTDAILDTSVLIDLLRAFHRQRVGSPVWDVNVWRSPP